MIEMKNKYDFIQGNIKSIKNSRELRDFLVKNVKGYGYKEASHFLRNIGYKNLAILDRHILKNLLKYKVISEIPKSLTPKKYFEIENKFLDFSEKIKTKLLENFFNMLGKEKDKTAYKENDIEKALDYGAVNILLLSKKLKKGGFMIVRVPIDHWPRKLFGFFDKDRTHISIHKEDEIMSWAKDNKMRVISKKHIFPAPIFYDVPLIPAEIELILKK